MEKQSSVWRNPYMIFFYLFVIAASAGVWKAYADRAPDRFRKDELTDLGMLGQHQLHRLESFATVNGSTAGGFFLGSGSISGQISGEINLQFWWQRKPNEMVGTTLPYGKCRIIIDEEAKVPTAEFEFDESWLRENLDDLAPLTQRELQERAYAQTWLNNRSFIGAKLRMTRETLEQEVYLPKP